MLYAPFIFDLILSIALVVLGIFTLQQKTPREAVVQLMIYGLVLALAWVRVDAPDLALTEAAVGSGVTGALLLAALRRLGLNQHFPKPASAWVRIPATLGCALLGLLLSAVIIHAWDSPAGLTEAVYANLERSGSANPVTAVILNFRTFDTLLEIGVLLAAALSVYTLSGPAAGTPVRPPGPIFRFYLRWMTPVFWLVTLYMVWIGGRAPGGAFQAGALLSGLGALTLLGPSPWPMRLRRRVVRWGLTLGFGLFLFAAVWLWRHGSLFAYPTDQAKTWILIIEVACTLSIGISLTVMFAGCAGWLHEDPEVLS
jgi:multisubunit Na+/H+ antiporter MnhB subunit